MCSSVCIFVGVGNDTTAEKTKGDTKDHALGQWFLKHVDSGDLAVLTTARQQVGLSCYAPWC